MNNKSITIVTPAHFTAENFDGPTYVSFEVDHQLLDRLRKLEKATAVMQRDFLRVDEIYLSAHCTWSEHADVLLEDRLRVWIAPLSASVHGLTLGHLSFEAQHGNFNGRAQSETIGYTELQEIYSQNGHGSTVFHKCGSELIEEYESDHRELDESPQP